MNEQIINSIKSVVKANGKQGITGTNLQGVLVDMVQSLGAFPAFAGMATPSTTPTTSDANVFYLAYEAGEYSGFGVTLNGKTYNIIRRTSQGWDVVNTNIKTEEAIGEDIAEIIATALEGYSTTEQMNTAISQAVEKVIRDINLSDLTTFGGVATFNTIPPSDFKTKLYYFANQKGEYLGFGVTINAEGLHILEYNGSQWIATLLYGPDPIIPNYMYFEAVEDDFTFSFTNAINYSTDGVNFTQLAANTASPTINQGERFYFKDTLEPSEYSGIGQFSTTKQFNAGGNTMSLLYGDEFDGKEAFPVSNYTLHQLFGSTNIVDASQLLLPAKSLRSGCYRNMFQYCTSLTKAPSLPATTLTTDCYLGMFDGCTSLTKAPALPATTLTQGCYSRMFLSCENLTQAPELPAATLKSSCYYMLFYGCSSLTNITMLATDVSASGSLMLWVTRVAPSGTFVKAAGVTLPSGNDGIPNGWTVEER